MQNQSDKFTNTDIEYTARESKLLQSLKPRERLARDYKLEHNATNLMQTDQFGFVQINDQRGRSQTQAVNNNNNQSNKKKENLCINARIEKWNLMMKQYNKYMSYKFSKLKARTRKGIPDSLRSFIWQKFAGVSSYYQEGLYQILQNDPLENTYDNIIIKDLDRTFPQIQFFQERYGEGQLSLFKVLTAYARYNKDTGYVQGMGFITAMLLTYMDDESAFYVLHSLMKKYKMEGFYLPDFPELNKVSYIFLSLANRFTPKVYAALVKYRITPSMFAPDWFVTLFSQTLQFDILVRIFDVFLLEGFKVIYRFAVAFLKLNEKRILSKTDMNDLFLVLKDLYKGIDVEELFNTAFGFSISKIYILKLENEYEKEKSSQNPKNEILTLL